MIWIWGDKMLACIRWANEHGISSSLAPSEWAASMDLALGTVYLQGESPEESAARWLLAIKGRELAKPPAIDSDHIWKAVEDIARGN